MPIDKTYERLGWTRQQYAKHVGRANLEGGQATGLAVQPPEGSRPWIIGWVGVNGQTSNVGIRVYGSGAIQGFATDSGLGAGFATQRSRCPVGHDDGQTIGCRLINIQAPPTPTNASSQPA